MIGGPVQEALKYIDVEVDTVVVESSRTLMQIAPVSAVSAWKSAQFDVIVSSMVVWTNFAIICYENKSFINIIKCNEY